jgi:riboflavin kinase/FMN adenylyltransferase
MRVLQEAARALGSDSAVLVPDPHPMAVLGTPPAILTPLPERGRLLRRYGAEKLWRLPFDHELASMQPEEFVERILLGWIRPARVIVGFNFSYGKAARGDVRMLTAQLGERGVAVDVVAPAHVNGDVVSSSRVREALAHGQMEAVRAMLGRDFLVRGTVRPGAQRGRTLGFPTANVHCAADQAMPSEGIYAVRCLVEGRVLAGAASLGPRPTFDEDAPLLEVHLLDFTGDIYGQEVAVSFAARLRGIERYTTADALRAQIAQDCVDARSVLAVATGSDDMLG